MIRVPEGLRWACRGCGVCCTDNDLGPVEPEIVDGLRAARIEERWAPAAAGWIEERRSPDGRSWWFLARRDGACVFLTPERRCAVHSLLGAEKKPGFCREFPFHFVQDRDGTRAIVRADCAGFHQSSVDGPEVTEGELQEALTAPRLVGRRRFAPEAVEIFGRKVPLEQWLAIEADLPPDPGRIRDLLVARLGIEAPTADSGRATAVLRATLGLFATVLEQVVDQPGPPERTAFVREAIADLRRAESAAVARPRLAPDTEAYVDLLLRSVLLARTWSFARTVDAGLGWFAVGVAFAAAAGGPDKARFDPKYRSWSKLLANGLVQQLAARAAPAATEVFWRQ